MADNPLQSISRYWSLVGSPTVGWLPEDPADELVYRILAGSYAQTLSELVDKPCLFLLGEPALGKSTAIRREVDRLRSELPADEQAVMIDLAAISSDSALDSEFEDVAIQEWQTGQKILHLFLDSYDECLRHYPALKPRLLRNLSRLPLDRLRLRIACRSGDFPGSLPRDVLALWPTHSQRGSVQDTMYRLELLARRDVRVRAEAEGVANVDNFLLEVDRHNASMFAQRPLTLNALLGAFKRGEFPTSEAALYTFAARALCSEPGGDAAREARLGPESLLALAERVAVLMTLAGKDLLWIGPASELPVGALLLDDVVGGDEVVTGNRVSADRQSIQEVIGRCALFEVQDAQLIRWSQQSYREFLAAVYFSRRLPDKTKALQFFEHPGRPGTTARPIAPHLAEPAAWLAAIDESVARVLTDHDPGVLLRARHFIFPSIRPDLASWLLRETASGRAINLGWTAERARESVCHDGLPAQLREILNRSDANNEERSLACWLAGACRFSELETALLAIALDAVAALSTRWTAVLALGEVGSEETHAALRPLLDTIQGPSSASHRLRGQVLSVVWPRYLSTSEALEYLRILQQSPTDEYRETFGSRFVPRMGPVHLAEALAWIRTTTDQDDGALDRRMAEILLAAAGSIDDDRVCAELASTLVARAKSRNHTIPFDESKFFDTLSGYSDELRTTFADALAVEYASQDGGPAGTVYEISEFIARLDLPYDALVGLASKTTSANSILWWQALTSDRRTWAHSGAAHLIRQAFTDAELNSVAEELFQALIQRVEAAHRPESSTEATPHEFT